MNSVESRGRVSGDVVSAERSVSVGGAAGPGARAAVGRGGVAWRFGQLARVAGVLGAAWAVGSGCAADVEAGDGGEATEVEAQRQEAAGGEASIFGFPFTAESRLLRSLTDLANYGEKRAGTTAGKKAGDYVKARFQWAGLSDVKLEEFSLNGFDVSSSSLSLTVTTPEGQTQALPIAGHQAFAYSGKGTVSNVEVVDVGTGTPAEYVAPVTGKVVLVKASQTFHRTSQLKLALERGAVAMISASSAPANLVQVGGVAPAELGLGPAPALSIGGVDGAALKSAIAAGQTVRATLGVNAAITTRKGRNVVGRLKRPGSKPNDPYILVGAHYDTWATGATDNGTGVAAMLEIAETLDRWPARRYDVVFVGYDAEEVGLLGGYDYLRRHVVRGHDSIVAFVHLEMIGRAQPSLQGDLVPRFFVYSRGGPLERVTGEADMGSIYPNVLGLENVAPLSGGLIPTDVQGLYWGGVEGTIAFGASPFYHTVADTPDTVDMPFLATNTAALRQLIDEVDQEPPASFGASDPTRMYPEVHLDRSNPALTRVDVTVRDADGQIVPTPWARVQLFVNDFVTPQQGNVPPQNAGVQEVVGDANGKVTFDIASSLVNAGAGSRWVHVRVGKATERFPRGEGVVEVK